MHFHREWHASSEGRGKRFFNDEITGDRDLDFQQIVQMIAALQSVPSVEARPEFVQELRARLVAEVEAAALVQAHDDVQALIARQGDSKPVSAEQLGRLQEVPQGFRAAVVSPD